MSAKPVKLTVVPKPEGRLAVCEEIIQKGMETFVDVGKALAEIRDNKLYKGEYKTFEAYCLMRWAFTYRHANRLIASSEVIANLGPIGPISPTHEGQIRPLLALKDKVDQVKAWESAVTTAGGKNPTAQQVQIAVDKIHPPKKKVSKPRRKKAASGTMSREGALTTWLGFLETLPDESKLTMISVVREWMKPKTKDFKVIGNSDAQEYESPLSEKLGRTVTLTLGGNRPAREGPRKTVGRKPKSKTT
jgi:hypothetical protein